MSLLIGSALLVSASIYLWIGFASRSSSGRLEDYLPIASDGKARIRSQGQFSATAIATTVSLPTIVLAYFEMAGFFGIYLFWTVATSVFGMWLLVRLAPRIIHKMNAYAKKPTLHEYLGSEFQSETLTRVASICTSIGYVLILATELTVGSRFLASLTDIPGWTAVILLAFLVLAYTSIGGFNAVIVSDRIQMNFVWLLVIILLALYATSTPEQMVRSLDEAFSTEWKESLLVFVIGIALMNIPTHICNMAMWQRFAAAESDSVVLGGLRWSAVGILLAWGGVALAAILTTTYVEPGSGGLLVNLLSSLEQTFLGQLTIFLIGMGLIAALLSTASTNLIALGHTISLDILPNGGNERNALRNTRLVISAILLLGLLVFAIFEHYRFSIVDMVFAIYGGALALLPAILISLFAAPNVCKAMGLRVTYGVALGFLVGWLAAFAGKILGYGDIVFLAPTIGIAVSSLIIVPTWLVARQNT